MENTIFRIKLYELPVLNGINKVNVPVDSDILGVLVKDTEPGGNIVRLIVEEPAVQENPNDVVEERILVVNDSNPYGNVLEDDEELMYVGTATWDNAYRINHVFRIVSWGEMEDFEDLPDAKEGLKVENTEGDIVTVVEETE